MINRTNAVSTDELVIIHRAAKAAGICLVEGTTRIDGTFRRWMPTSNVEDATSLLIALKLSLTQSEGFIEVGHSNNPDIILARIKGHTSQEYCTAISHAASNMLTFSENKKNHI